MIQTKKPFKRPFDSRVGLCADLSLQSIPILAVTEARPNFTSESARAI